jgi:hypothetical protein
VQIAYSQAKKVVPAPLTYQQQFDKSLDNLNAGLAVYAGLDCTDPTAKSVANSVSNDLEDFVNVLKNEPADDVNYTKNTEMELGVLDVVDSILDKKKTCISKAHELNPNNSSS